MECLRLNLTKSFPTELENHVKLQINLEAV